MVASGPDGRSVLRKARRGTRTSPVSRGAWTRLRVSLLALLVVPLVLPVPAVAQTVSLAVTLDRVASYTDVFIEYFRNVVSEEHYQQEVLPGINARELATVPATQRRTLRSDFLLVKPSDVPEWSAFRDVYEVDGAPVRDRDERLAKLFLKSSSTTLDHARQIAQEGSMYNIGNVVRTINSPVIALAFLERSYQQRFAFKMGKADPAAGLNVWILEYREQALPTLIRAFGGRDLPTHGRVWIDAETGRVLKTELQITDVTISATVTTTFRPDPLVPILVPVEMVEEYKPAQGRPIRGKATYGRFRQFGVKTEENITSPAVPRNK